MIDQSLKDYIQQNLSSGFAETEIRKVLRDAGWSELDVEEAFLEINPPANPPAAAPVEPRVQSRPQPVALRTAAPAEPAVEVLPKQESFFSANKKLFIGLLIFIVVFPVLAYGGIIGYEKFFKSQGTQTVTPPSPPPAPPAAAPDPLLDAKTRDSQRLEDIKNIQDGLSAFFTEKQTFPQTLGELVLAGKLTQVPTDPKTKQNYLYTPLGEPVLHYSLSFILETDHGTMKSGLQVGSSETKVETEAIQQQEDAVQGAFTIGSANLIITNLSASTFYPQEEVTLEIRATDTELTSAILTMEHLNLIDQRQPWAFRFSAPKNPGEYTVKIVAFDKNGKTLSQTTKLIVRGGGN